MVALLVVISVVGLVMFTLTRRPKYMDIKYLPKGLYNQIEKTYKEKSETVLPGYQSKEIFNYIIANRDGLTRMALDYTQVVRAHSGQVLTTDAYEIAVSNFIAFVWPAIYSGAFSGKDIETSFNEYMQVYRGIESMTDSERKEYSQQFSA